MTVVLQRGAAILVVVFMGVFSAHATQYSRSILFPKSIRAVKSEHQLHASKKIKCETCHPGIATSRFAKDDNISGMVTCKKCHKEAVNKGAFNESCSMCHLKKGTTFMGHGVLKTPKIKFSHVAHKKQSCTACHRQIIKNKMDTWQMKECYSCHKQTKKSLAQCRVCHLVHKDGRMKTNLKGKNVYPPTWLKGKNHGVDWTGNHAFQAGSDSKFCSNCHRETFCQNCHLGKLNSKGMHPADWVNTHGVHSSMETPSCQNCHRSQSFCITCHRRTGVAPDAPISKRGQHPASFHKAMVPEQICKRAKTNITACASCHSESSCITCHQRINPHPPGFSRRCKKLASKNSRACKKCHFDNPKKRCN